MNYACPHPKHCRSTLITHIGCTHGSCLKFRRNRELCFTFRQITPYHSICAVIALEKQQHGTLLF